MVSGGVVMGGVVICGRVNPPTPIELMVSSGGDDFLGGDLRQSEAAHADRRDRELRGGDSWGGDLRQGEAIDVDSGDIDPGYVEGGQKE